MQFNKLKIVLQNTAISYKNDLYLKLFMQFNKLKIVLQTLQ